MNYLRCGTCLNFPDILLHHIAKRNKQVSYVVTYILEWNLSDFNDAQRHVSDVQYNALAMSVPDNIARWARYVMDSRVWTSSIIYSRLQDSRFT